MIKKIRYKVLEAIARYFINNYDKQARCTNAITCKLIKNKAHIKNNIEVCEACAKGLENIRHVMKQEKFA